jgi:hypothetical protein
MIDERTLRMAVPPKPLLLRCTSRGRRVSWSRRERTSTSQAGGRVRVSRTEYGATCHATHHERLRWGPTMGFDGKDYVRPY